MGELIELGSRLRIVRTPLQQAQHTAQERKRRYLASSRESRARQRALRLRRLAKWADRKKIADIYREANRITRRTGVPHEVDHIIPLQGKSVSGLHVETNLRVIPRSENIKKSNRYEGEVVGDAGFEPATFRV